MAKEEKRERPIKEDTDYGSQRPGDDHDSIKKRQEDVTDWVKPTRPKKDDD